MNPRKIRAAILHMAYRGNACHIGSAFSCVEILAALHDSIATSADTVILSKGHGVMTRYAIDFLDGRLTQDDLDAYLADGTTRAGCCHPGGAVGHGLPIALGRALGQIRRGGPRRVFCVTGDGELDEGACWEAIAQAAHWGVGNLVLIVDQNGFQALGPTQDALSGCDERLVQRLRAAGWLARECSAGNDAQAVATALVRLLAQDPTRPKALVCRTIKGYGVDFMAGTNDWHYLRLTEEQYHRALADLDRGVAVL